MYVGRWIRFLPALALLLVASVPADAARRRDPGLAQHVLDRVAYGPDAWSRARVEAIGARGFVLEQLHPESIDDRALEPRLADFPSLTMGFEELRAAYGDEEGQLPRSRILQELQQARMLRAVASRRQLQEVLVDFWFDHFNVNGSRNNQSRYDVSPYERIAIRPHVLGRFEELLLAVARSPAMADYLDNRFSSVGAINENYSRELLELHTLGVDAPYSEADVVEVARCFTGWRTDYSRPDGFVFDAGRHDQGAKVIMGSLRIPANGGYQDGVAVVRFLASHPSTASSISRKLVVRFVSESPPPRLVAAAAAAFLASGGDLREVLSVILSSPEFLDAPQLRQTKAKRPLRLLASIARATGSDPDQLALDTMVFRASTLGEGLLQAAPPTGYPDHSGAWISPGTMVGRFNLGEAASRNGSGFVFDYPPPGGGAARLVNTLIAKISVAPFSAETRLGAIAFAFELRTNEEQRARAALAYLLSSPEFLTH